MKTFNYRGCIFFFFFFLTCCPLGSLAAIPDTCCSKFCLGNSSFLCCVTFEVNFKTAGGGADGCTARGSTVGACSLNCAGRQWAKETGRQQGKKPNSPWNSWGNKFQWPGRLLENNMINKAGAVQRRTGLLTQLKFVGQSAGKKNQLSFGLSLGLGFASCSYVIH